ncbi:MAG: hypothetical protein QOG62_1499 [Thermoleophilaceae bacterium]|nr:hypothetical protein [Thermoleophilaceae bacterium]
MITRGGTSLRKVLQLAGADPDQVGVIEIARPHGGTTTLTGADAADPTPFADGPPLFSVDGTATRFLRPVRNGTDVNADDNISTENGQPLTVHVDADDTVAVTASANRTTVKATEIVTFTGTVTGGHPGERFELDWNFGDGTAHGAGPTPGHVFAAAGTYNVVAKATGDEGSSGEAAPVVIQVTDDTDPDPDPGGGGGKGGGGKGGGGKGNGNGGGHGNGNGNGNGHGNGGHGKGHKKHGNGHGGGGGGHGGSGGSSSTTSPTTTTPSITGSTTTPVTPPSTVTPLAPPPPPTPPAPTPPPATPPPPTPPPATAPPPPPPPAQTGEQVSGLELGGPGAPALRDAGGDDGGGTDGGTQDPTKPVVINSTPPPEVQIGLGGVLVLLLGGAGLESWTIRRHRPTPIG